MTVVDDFVVVVVAVKGIVDLPHVDQVLCQGDWLSVAGDSDGSVSVAAIFTVLAIGDSNHRPTQLSVTKIIKQNGKQS